LPGAGYGFGLGFAVRKPGAPADGPQGDYTWNGVGGTHFWVFPKDDMFVVFMIQSVRQRPRYMAIIPKMVWDAIDK
jgi:CubicO group peptidase (beta-lactamase class C family)